MTPLVPTTVRYAGFFKRLAAFVIDMAILNLLWDGGMWYLSHLVWVPQADWALMLFDTEGWVFGWLYQAGFETSPWQATPGKMLLGLKVCNAQFGPLTFMQASVRYWAQLLSFIPLFGGYVYMIWSPRRQTWHDMLARATVLDMAGETQPEQRQAD